MDSLLPVLTGVFVGVVTVLASWMLARRRLGDVPRRVEEPNSHYSSRAVKDRDDRERWGKIDMAHLHPLNQEEVQRLLALADVDGIGALSDRDRIFLENMARARKRA